MAILCQRGNLGATHKDVVMCLKGHEFQVMETVSCVKNKIVAYNTPDGGTPSRTLLMREL